MPVDGATDLDGNYYIVKAGNTIRKYDTSFYSVWVHDIPGAVDYILIDGRGMIYLAYHVAVGSISSLYAAWIWMAICGGRR